MPMENRNQLEIEGPTVAEAVAHGLARLGVTEDQIEITVLDEGSPVASGGNGLPARVRLTLRENAEPLDPELESIRQITQDLVDRMRFHGRTTAKWIESEDEREPRHALVEIHGQELGILVSRRGEALSAMQYLVRLLAGRRLGNPVPVILDVEGFRQRREQQLRRMAVRAAEQATERGRTVVLEPMPANERRIIHLALRDHPGVVTESVGLGRARKVTIIPRSGGEAEKEQNG